MEIEVVIIECNSNYQQGYGDTCLQEDINVELKTLEEEVNSHKRQLEDITSSYADVINAELTIEKRYASPLHLIH